MTGRIGTLSRRPVPIIALDVASDRAALALLDRLGSEVEFVKIGLQLFTASGPGIIRSVRERGCRVFLDLKLHDIPNTVAGAVASAADLGVDLLTVHASGGREMLRAARRGAGDVGHGGPGLLAVTVLTSLSDGEVADAWGRDSCSTEQEVERLAGLAHETEMDGVVASVREVAGIRRHTSDHFQVLTPGIRLAGDEAGDQARTATPAEAVRAGSDFLILGRSVTAAADPAAALGRALQEIAAAAGG